MSAKVAIYERKEATEGCATESLLRKLDFSRTACGDTRPYTTENCPFHGQGTRYDARLNYVCIKILPGYDALFIAKSAGLEVVLHIMICTSLHKINIVTPCRI